MTMVQPIQTNVLGYVVSGRQLGRAPLVTHADSTIQVAELRQGLALPLAVAAVGTGTTVLRLPVSP